MGKVRNSIFMLGALLFFACLATAQESTTGIESKKADVNLTELAKYYEAHQLVPVKMPVG